MNDRIFRIEVSWLAWELRMSKVGKREGDKYASPNCYLDIINVNLLCNSSRATLHFDMFFFFDLVGSKHRKIALPM